MTSIKKNSLKTLNRRWSIIAISGFFLFGFILFVMHFIHPEINLLNRFMSEFILGEHGWILNIAITSNLIGFISLIVAIYLAYPPPHRSWLALLSLGIAMVCILSNYFPVDIYGKANTISGHIHNLGGFVGSIAGLIFMFVFSLRLKEHGLLRGSYRILIFLVFCASVLFLGLVFFFEQMSEFIGVVQRFYAAAIIAWFIIIANGIRTGSITPEKE